MIMKSSINLYPALRMIAVFPSIEFMYLLIQTIQIVVMIVYGIDFCRGYLS